MTIERQPGEDLDDIAAPLQRFFIFIQCSPGLTYDVGLEIARKKKDFVKDVSSTSGKWDLLVLAETRVGADIGQEIANLFKDIPGIVRTNTIAAYNIEAS